MALYLETSTGVFELYTGEQLVGTGKSRGRQNAAALESLWTESALSSIGLYQPVEADPVPDGKLIASTSVKRVDGVVKYVHALEDEPVIIPQSISMRQARLALLQAGLLSSVEAAIDAIAEPARTAARIEWEYATEMKRDHTLIETLAVGLSLTPEQIDQLFQTAAAL